MKYFYLLLCLMIGFVACQDDISSGDTNGIDLYLESFDYFEDDIPFQSTSYETQENHDKIASLGRILFYDMRLSQNNSIACASCHQQERGFSDSERFSKGLHNYETQRNSMTLVNNAYQVSHFWEGHLGEIDDHILSPISNHIEMGMRSTKDLVEKLNTLEDYPDLFNEVFGSAVSEEGITNALSTFVASLISYQTKFDKGKDVNFTNFTLKEQAGKTLFEGKAKCGECHKGNHYVATWRLAANIGLDMNYEDEGAGSGAFKVPSLRNIALTDPYMHDGRFETLEEVVDHYVNGVREHPNLDWDLREPIDLSLEEQSELVAYLHTLTDYELISDEKFSNPFR